VTPISCSGCDRSRRERSGRREVHALCSPAWEEMQRELAVALVDGERDSLKSCLKELLKDKELLRGKAAKERQQLRQPSSFRSLTSTGSSGDSPILTGGNGRKTTQVHIAYMIYMNKQKLQKLLQTDTYAGSSSCWKP
jgi:hypothetical protein